MDKACYANNHLLTLQRSLDSWLPLRTIIATLRDSSRMERKLLDYGIYLLFSLGEKKR